MNDDEDQNVSTPAVSNGSTMELRRRGGATKKSENVIQKPISTTDNDDKKAEVTNADFKPFSIHTTLEEIDRMPITGGEKPPRLWLAYLLWLPPWGIFGLHWLYMGHWTRAVLYSQTLGGFGLDYITDLYRIYDYVTIVRDPKAYVKHAKRAMDAHREPPDENVAKKKDDPPNEGEEDETCCKNFLTPFKLIFAILFGILETPITLCLPILSAIWSIVVLIQSSTIITFYTLIIRSSIPPWVREALLNPKPIRKKFSFDDLFDDDDSSRESTASIFLSVFGISLGLTVGFYIWHVARDQLPRGGSRLPSLRGCSKLLGQSALATYLSAWFEGDGKTPSASTAIILVRIACDTHAETLSKGPLSVFNRPRYRRRHFVYYHLYQAIFWACLFSVLWYRGEVTDSKNPHQKITFGEAMTKYFRSDEWRELKHDFSNLWTLLEQVGLKEILDFAMDGLEIGKVTDAVSILKMPSCSFDDDELKKICRKRRAEMHPDRNPTPPPNGKTAQQVFIEVGEACKTLQRLSQTRRMWYCRLHL